jgi:hypothetical protein
MWPAVVVKKEIERSMAVGPDDLAVVTSSTGGLEGCRIDARRAVDAFQPKGGIKGSEIRTVVVDVDVQNAAFALACMIGLDPVSWTGA